MCGISVLIPTKDEELNLPGCLTSVAWSDDVFVYDSFSTDRTVELAESFGATVVRREKATEGSSIFGGDESDHKNWALRNIPFKYPWVLHVDADERVTRELATTMQLQVARNGPAVAYRVCRRDFFMGRWLRHVQASAFYLRLFRPERMRYERLINPVAIPDGPVETISGYLDHYPFSKGIGHWLDKHNSYSTLEARQIVLNRTNLQGFSFGKAFLELDYNVRRFHQKELFYRLPARALTKFLILYFMKRGFLDGRPGFTYAVLQSIYEYLIVLKTAEIDLAALRDI